MGQETELSGIAETAGLRASIVGGRKTLAEIASALGCCERTLRNVVDEQHIPYVKFLGKRFVEPEKLRDALLSLERNQKARSPGRPRKAA